GQERREAKRLQHGCLPVKGEKQAAAASTAGTGAARGQSVRIQAAPTSTRAQARKGCFLSLVLGAVDALLLVEVDARDALWRRGEISGASDPDHCRKSPGVVSR